MRVAYVCIDPGIPVFGTKGCSVHVQAIIGAMIGRGWRVDLFVLRTGGETPEGCRGVRVHVVPFQNPRDASERERSLLALGGVVADQIEQAGPFDLVYERHALWTGAGVGYARRAGIRSILEVNAPLIQEQQRYRRLHDIDGAQRAADRAFLDARRIVAVSEPVAAMVRERAPEADVRVVANGVDPGRFDSVAATPGAGAGQTIGFVGTLKPWHGLEVLVEALPMVRSRCPDARLLIVGDGPLRGQIEMDLESAGLGGAVRFTGSVRATEVPGLLGEMDVAVAPYPALESFYFSPLKVLEYMAAGRAIVASDVGQVAELISHNRTGLLCPPGDARALAEAIIRCLDDRVLRARLGGSARCCAVEAHTWEAVLDRALAGLADAQACAAGGH